MVLPSGAVTTTKKVLEVLDGSILSGCDGLPFVIGFGPLPSFDVMVAPAASVVPVRVIDGVILGKLIPYEKTIGENAG